MAAYVDITFPDRIAFGAQRLPGWSTGVVVTVAGIESRNQNWARARHRYELSFAVRTAADYRAVVEHFHSVRGRLKAFPFRDWLDYRVAVAEGVLVDAVSSSDGWQLAKRYGSGDDAWLRLITRPTLCTIWRTRSMVTTDITGLCTIDLSTGQVDAGSAIQPGDAVAWEGEFVVPCRYDVDELTAVIVNRAGGADADYDNLLVQCDSIPIVEVREGVLS